MTGKKIYDETGGLKSDQTVRFRFEFFSNRSKWFGLGLSFSQIGVNGLV